MIGSFKYFVRILKALTHDFIKKTFFIKSKIINKINEYIPVFMDSFCIIILNTKFLFTAKFYLHYIIPLAISKESFKIKYVFTLPKNLLSRL